MKQFWRMAFVLLLGTGLVLGGFPAVYGQEEEEDKAKKDDMSEFTLEEVVVTSERGEVLVLDRAMTVTGFNAQMVEKMGIQTIEDLQVLVPGLQVGNRTQGGSKGEDDHYYMRGLGSERTINHFSDVAVAVYVDGIWTDQTYGTDGFFDVERIEVARGPQGTTGGRAALAGAISFYTRKPTETFDAILRAEFTDQFTQQYQIAFGGPILDSDFSYRLRASSLTGEGQIENVYAGGVDAGEPDQFIWSPQLRWKTNRWDVTLRYSDQKDTGTPMVSLPLGARNTIDEFLDANNDGEPDCSTNEVTGEETCARNPFFGANANPAVANCDNISQDGTRDPSNIICNPDDLQHKVAFNAPIFQDNSAKAASIDAIFNVTDSLVLNYKGGWRDTVNRNMNDLDQLPREGGGVCLWNHPKVLGGMLTAGQTSRYCALDGGGDGSFADDYWEIGFTSEQWSHEISLYSNFDGPFNFTVGAVYIDGDEPLDYLYTNKGSAAGNWLYEDTSAACEAIIESLYGTGGSLSGGENWLLRDLRTSDEAMAHAFAGLYACPGSPEVVNYSMTGNPGYAANPNGVEYAFFGNAAYTNQGIYFNLEYEINDAWRVFGGARHDKDVKDHLQNTFSWVTGVNAANPATFYEGWGWYATACNNNTGEDCIGIATIPVRDGSIVGMEEKHDAEWDATIWNIGVEYRPVDDVMVYGRISTGYRAGGFYGYARSVPPFTTDAEEMTNYEIGAKGMFFDNVLQLEASYFFQDFDNYWVYADRLKTPVEMASDPTGNPVTSEVTNNDGTTIGGIELQGAWRISESFTLRGFYNWLDASIGDFEANYPFEIPGVTNPWLEVPWTDTAGVAQTAYVRDQPMSFGGNQLPNQPEHKGSLTLAYETDLPKNLGGLEVLTTYSYTGKKYVTLGNVETFAIDPYKRWDIRTTWRSMNQKYTVTLFAQNVLDQAGLQMWSPREGVDNNLGTVTEPREIGLIITWRY